MSLLRQNISVLLNGLDINTMQLTGYGSIILRLWFGAVIAPQIIVKEDMFLTY